MSIREDAVSILNCCQNVCGIETKTIKELLRKSLAQLDDQGLNGHMKVY